jgi:tetraacyldisaccharide 4'-kinase
MNSNFFIRIIRLLLFPIAIIYGCVIKFRNWMYDSKFFKSVSFNLPIINIGNLSVGGTGKTPMVEYLISKLHIHNRVAILSRGYGRKTKGYILANKHSTAAKIGDEPYMYYDQFPLIKVAVGEKRILAVPKLLQDAPKINVIILDDAFQHRAIKPSINLLLTDYNNLYSDDYFLPTGNLRDEKSSAIRAAIIIVSKCPYDLSIEKRNIIKQKLQLNSNQQLFFTCIQYKDLRGIEYNSTISLSNIANALLVTGIANPKPIEKLLKEKNVPYKKLSFADHHNFNIFDIQKIKSSFSSIDSENKIIITTHKDAVRLLKYKNEISHLPIYILPIEIHFLFNEEEKFMNFIKSHILNFDKN